MIPKQQIEKDSVELRTTIATHMIKAGIEDGSLRPWIDRKIDDMAARIELYKYMEVV